MTVSSGPLPLLPMWAMASSVVVGVGLGGGAGKDGQGCVLTVYTCFYYCVVLFNWLPRLEST